MLMGLLVHSPLVRFALALLVLASSAGCRRVEREELSPGFGPLAQRVLARAGARLDPGAAGEGGRAEGRAVPTSSDGATPPAGYLLVHVKAQVETAQGNALLLVDAPEKRLVPIFIGGTEALSIRLRLDGKRYARPLTHDLLDTLLRRLGAKLESVQVDELRDSTFIGTVVVRDRDGQQLRIDARPSDAVALALGNKVPIFMAQTVLDRAGYRMDELDKIVARPGGTGQIEPTRL
jgi:uncharacterized protein